MIRDIALLIRPLTITFVLLLSSVANAQQENNTSLTGTRLTYYQRPSASQCQADCANNPNCQGTTWIAAGTYNRSDPAMCYLLSAVTGRTSAAGHISSVKSGSGTGGGGQPATPPPPPPPPPGATAATWFTKSNASSPDGQRFSFNCPPMGPEGFLSMWGTDIYTFDSGICMAGVHVGVITRERGGVVTIEMRPGQSSYPASVRNGVSSQGYGSYNKSFAVVTR